MRKVSEILRKAVKSNRYNPSQPWLCNVLGNLYRSGLIDTDEWEAALDAVHELAVSIYPNANRGDPLITVLRLANVSAGLSDKEWFRLCKTTYLDFIKRLEARDA